MRMDEMNRLFEERGFTVTRNWCRDGYNFIIGKGGHQYSSVYVYPSGLNTREASQHQRKFVDNMIKIFEDRFKREKSMYSIKNVIFNDPATIVFWTDGTKTVVKAGDEDFDPEKGLAMAISKKALGNQGNYYEVFKKWLPKEDPEMDQMLVKALFGNIMATIGRNTEEYKCSTCARFDDENMSCMISNCEKYSRYVKKEK